MPQDKPKTRMMGVYWAPIIRSEPDFDKDPYYLADGTRWFHTALIEGRRKFCVTFGLRPSPEFFNQTANDN